MTDFGLFVSFNEGEGFPSNEYNESPPVREYSSVNQLVKEPSLMFEEPCSPLGKFKHYLNSHDANRRLVITKSLKEIMEQLGYEDSLKEIVPHLDLLANDSDLFVRLAIADQLVVILKFFLDHMPPNDTSALEKTLTDLLMCLIKDDDDRVRKAAIVAFSEMVHRFSPGHVLNVLVPRIEILSGDTELEENRCISVALLSYISGVLNDDVQRKNLILPEISRLANDSSFKIRKCCAENLGNLVKTIELDSFRVDLYLIFEKLCEDENWGVRKACTDAFPALVEQGLRHPERFHSICKSLKSLMSDTSRWVRLGALQALGDMFAIIPENSEVPEFLIDNFIEAIHHYEEDPDHDFMLVSAYALSSLLGATKSLKWNILNRVYMRFARSVQHSVRAAIARGLSNVTRSLGSEIASRDLYDIFELYLRDLDEVKVEILEHLFKLLLSFDQEHRNMFLSTFPSFVTSLEDNWRHREILVSQLEQCTELYGSDQILKSICPEILKLAHDPVARVRYVAHRCISRMLRVLLHDPDVKDDDSFLIEIQKLAADPNYHIRGGYIHICQDLIDLPLASFERHFLPNLFILSHDSVPNVRLAVSQLFVKFLNLHTESQTHAKILDSLKILQGDEDVDVRYFANYNGVSIEGTLDKTLETIP